MKVISAKYAKIQTSMARAKALEEVLGSAGLRQFFYEEVFEKIVDAAKAGKGSVALELPADIPFDELDKLLHAVGYGVIRTGESHFKVVWSK